MLNSKMTALADEIRELSGTTTVKGIDAMTTDVNAANTEISEQMDLIAQISTALEGKASGGGSEDVTEETNAYTTKLVSLETAVTALETELAGKASGGGGSAFKTSTIRFEGGMGAGSAYFYYMDQEGAKNVLFDPDSLPLEFICVNGWIMFIAYTGPLPNVQSAGYVEGSYNDGYVAVFKVSGNGTITFG